MSHWWKAQQDRKTVSRSSFLLVGRSGVFDDRGATLASATDSAWNAMICPDTLDGSIAVDLGALAEGTHVLTAHATDLVQRCEGLRAGASAIGEARGSAVLNDGHRIAYEGRKRRRRTSRLSAPPRKYDVS